MGPQFIFQITDLTKKFGQRELLKEINVAFYPGEDWAARSKWCRQKYADEDHGGT